MGTEYFAGYITDKALSVDNLFVFLIIMSSVKVPGRTSRRCCCSASCSP
jgi:tellurite resistance protein TerC